MLDACSACRPPPLNGRAHAWHLSIAQLAGSIKQGGQQLDGVMPGFGQTGRSTDSGVDHLLPVQMANRDLQPMAQSAHAVIFSFVIITFLGCGCTYKGTGQWGLASFSNQC
jgi:hypothetical protein